MYRTAELTQSWGAASAEVGQTLSAHDGWSAAAVALQGAGVWHFFRRYGNGSEPDPEGPIRFLIEREGE
jgi:hypothetical protein